MFTSTSLMQIIPSEDVQIFSFLIRDSFYIWCL
ncbi:hypothetical protein SEVIR_5G422700v4 [Setaria viridis]